MWMKPECLFHITVYLKFLTYHKGVFRTQSNNYDGAFLRKIAYVCKKSSIIDIRLGSKYTPISGRWWIVFVVWLTEEMRFPVDTWCRIGIETTSCVYWVSLILNRTTVRDPHHRESPKRREQVLNSPEPEFRLSWMKMFSSDNDSYAFSMK